MEYIKSLFSKVGTSILSCGPIPRHIAIIMDGNRRYARNLSIPIVEGHAQGGRTLVHTLKWCIEVGISIVTVFAFSIENFKRSEQEVNDLMNLMREKIIEVEQYPQIMENIKIQIIGETSLLPEDVQLLISNIVTKTSNNTRLLLNICLAYTSTFEICRGIKLLVNKSIKEDVDPRDIDIEMLERNLYTFDCIDPDLLIRTSGEIRLSDFLLWQTTTTCMVFLNVLWPNFSFFHLLYAIFLYQRNYSKQRKIRENINL